jgi:hypothetical protein
MCSVQEDPLDARGYREPTGKRRFPTQLLRAEHLGQIHECAGQGSADTRLSPSPETGHTPASPASPA